MGDACGQLKFPWPSMYLIPSALFAPTDRFSERYEEFTHHPDWSFYGGDFPSNAESLEARNRVFRRHAKTLDRPGRFLKDIRAGLCLGPTRLRTATNIPQQVFNDRCTRFAIVSSRPMMSTSTMHRRRSLLKGGGVSPASICRKTILRKVHFENAARQLNVVV